MEYQEIYHNFYPVIQDFLKKKINNHQDAQDLTHEVFYKVFKKELVGIKNLGGWIYQVANNALIDYYRAKKLPVSDFNQVLSETNIESDIEFQHLLEDEIKCCFLYFLNEMDEETRYILRSVELENKKQKDLAIELGMSYATLRSKVQRGRKKIRSRFLDICDMKFDKYGNVMECTSKGNPSNCGLVCPD